jgi:hypothetical protein
MNTHYGAKGNNANAIPWRPSNEALVVPDCPFITNYLPYRHRKSTGGQPLLPDRPLTDRGFHELTEIALRRAMPAGLARSNEAKRPKSFHVTALSLARNLSC